jgi:hypothetical protein
VAARHHIDDLEQQKLHQKYKAYKSVMVKKYNKKIKALLDSRKPFIER